MGKESSLLGTNVELTGFRDIDSSTMLILTKSIIHHANRIKELTKRLEKIRITLKQVHEREKSEKYEIHVKVVDDGKIYSSEITDRNLLLTVDTALKKIINEIKK